MAGPYRLPRNAEKAERQATMESLHSTTKRQHCDNYDNGRKYTNTAVSMAKSTNHTPHAMSTMSHHPPTAIKERPILFTGPMVRAILEGKKTQTRRLVKPPPVDLVFAPGAEPWDASTGYALISPYGMPSDRLWVRETWGLFSDLGFCDTSLAGLQALPDLWQLAYRVDHIDPVRGDGPHLPFWRSSTNMPRWASRITLEITGVRVERLQEISEADARAEGVEPTISIYEDCGGFEHEGHRDAFWRLWQSIHGPDSWDANPWVWVVEFRRVQP